MKMNRVLTGRRGSILGLGFLTGIYTYAIARPIINAIEFGAAPQMAEPISNKATVDKNTSFTL